MSADDIPAATPTSARGKPDAVDMGQTQAALAETLARSDLPQRLRWAKVHGDAGWRAWDGRRWAPCDESLPLPLQAAVRRAVADAMEARRLTPREAGHLESAAGVRGIGELLRAWPQMAMAGDVDPAGLLVTPSACIDLRQGDPLGLVPHEPGRAVTRCTGCDPVAGSELWAVIQSHLEVCAGEAYTPMHRLLGGALLGRGTDRKLLWLHGSGGDGKSTLAAVLRNALGDYACAVPAEFLSSDGARGAHGHELASGLAGSRLAIVAEVGARLNWPLIKTLSGGDVQASKRLHGRRYEFKRPPLLVVLANHRPDPPDDAAAERLLVVEMRKPDELDERLHQVLADGGPGRDTLAGAALAWLLTGCAEYLAHGLGRVPAFRRAPSPLEAWWAWALARGLVREGGGPTPLREVEPLLRQWEEETGASPCNLRSLSDFLTDQVGQVRTMAVRGYRLRMTLHDTSPASPTHVDGETTNTRHEVSSVGVP